MNALPESTIFTLICEAAGEEFVRALPTAGGSINATSQLFTRTGRFFCKVNIAAKFPGLFAKEADALGFLRKQQIVRVPQVFSCGIVQGFQYLLLEWIDEGNRNHAFWKSFGSSLAKLHGVREDLFGWKEDNFMGSVRQVNERKADWVSFFVSCRLQPLVEICRNEKKLDRKEVQQFEKLYLQLPQIFGEPLPPSLVHGDLWSGNFMCDQNSEPVLIDPALHFGHPAMDLGMSVLFGGLHKTFYDSYQESNPFPLNHRQQWDICNLYPLLIHLHLFGTSYLIRIKEILNRFA